MNQRQTVRGSKEKKEGKKHGAGQGHHEKIIQVVSHAPYVTLAPLRLEEEIKEKFPFLVVFRGNERREESPTCADCSVDLIIFGPSSSPPLLCILVLDRVLAYINKDVW